ACFSEKLGYSCCKNTKEVVYTDADGKWGVENNNWCGIEDDCWSTRLGYPCCKSTTKVEFTDSDGKWGIENGDWCGIKTTTKTLPNNGN
ncbi:Non-catalytic module family DOC2, partial [Piromyces sp. E2]